MSNAIDFEQVFSTELANSIYYSDKAVAKLRELIEEEKKEEFGSFLAKVLSVGFLDEFDCRSVYQLCTRLGIPSITRAYLEQVVKFYPENEELSSLLANEYSKNYHTGEKAIQMVNGIIGVIRKDGKYALTQTAGKVTTTKLASFCDVYLHLHKYQDLVAIGLLLCERYNGNDKIMAMVLRNMAYSYLYLDDLDNARVCKNQLLSIAPLRVATHWAAMKYENAVENYAQVVEELENCILLESEDVDYYLSMAGYICDNLFVRDPGTLTIKTITIKEADQYAVPFLLTALDIDRNCINKVIDFLRRNKFGTYIQEIVDAYQTGVSSFREAFTEFNYGAVNYCFGKTL